jgi:hypothetical protein
MDGNTVPGMDPMETELAWESKWEALGDHVLARLRQPAFGPDAEWFQVLSVREGRITKLRDYPTREAAVEAVERAP